MELTRKLILTITLSIINVCSGFGQVMEFAINGAAAQDRIGSALAISDDGLTLVIGAPSASVGGTLCGKANIYKKSGNNWIQFGPDLIGVNLYDGFGSAVSISADGTRAAISAPEFDINTFVNNGIVRIYDLTGSTWLQIGSDIQGSNSEGLGKSVALNGDGSKVVFGSNGTTGAGAGGRANVYRDSSGTWVKVGLTINGEASGDVFGSSVAISANGNRIFVGAPFNGGNGIQAGHVRAFDLAAGNWIQIGADIDGEASMNYFGNSIAVSNDGNRLVVGAHANVNVSGVISGHARVFDLIGNSWVQVGSDIEGDFLQEQFGSRVSISGNGLRLLIASPFYLSSAGRAKIFEFDGTNWVQTGNTISGSGNTGIGLDQSLNGSRLAVGSPFASSTAGPNTGIVRLYGLSGLSSVENISENNFLIYPNPFTSHIEIHSKTNKLSGLRIKNLLGEQVLFTEFNTDTDINTMNVIKGIYFYEIKDDKGIIVKSGKLIKL
ncbi:MAG: T9SS type A sorting domain-containing protein [Bacteroidetes bacterium]|nr:T9SS type A sorting domain-containing protein [Bacteroidota bacterium]